MAYLPTVNEVTPDRKSNLESANGIVNSLSKRMRLDSSNNSFLKMSTDNDDKTLSTVGASDKTTDVLTKLYDFVVKDYNQKDLEEKEDSAEREKSEDNAQDREMGLLQALPQLLKGSEEEDKEGILSRLWRYFKYFNFGKMVYNNWDKISKILGLEKLTESIKGIADELGITKIIDGIKSTIDEIMNSFRGTTAPSQVTGDVGRLMSTIKAVETRGSKDPYTQKAKVGSASGAYQMIDSTWQKFAQKVPGAEKYKSAYMAPPEVQDAVAKVATEEAMKKSDGDIRKFANVWYTGNPEGKMTSKGLAANKGLQSSSYGDIFAKEFEKQGGMVAPTTPQTKSPEPEVKKEEKPVFSMEPKKNDFETKSPTENVFQVTSPNLKVTQPTAERVPKKPELAMKTESKVPKVVGNNPLDIANKFLRKDEKTDASELNSFIGQNFGRFDVSKTPWCAAFANSVLNAAGFKGTGNASASSFLNMPGVVYDKLTAQGNVQDAKPGDVAVFSRTGGHHVGFVQSVDPTGITIVGGNQSDKDSGGQVSVSRRGFDELLGIRRPGSFSSPTLLSETVAPPNKQVRPSQKPKSLMDMAVESYKSNMDIMNQFFSPEGIKNLEKGLVNFMENIPSKERFLPDFGSIIQQNNYVFNNVQEQRMILQNAITNQSDLPLILQQFLNEHQ